MTATDRSSRDRLLDLLLPAIVAAAAVAIAIAMFAVY
jgi:hypothetical protein